MKKKIAYIIMILLMLAPSFVAVHSYLSARNSPAGSKNIVKITVKDVQQNIYELDRVKDGERAEKLIDLIMEIRNGGKKISALPSSVSGSDPFLITLSTPVKDTSYQFYVGVDSTNCYFSLDGEAYQIKQEDAGKFLETEYAECLYVGANVPTLTVSSESAVKPSELSWQYRNYRGALTEKNTDAYLNKEEQSVEVIGAVTLNFSIEPDIYTVVITDEDGKVRYESTGENHAPVVFEEQTNVNVSVNAKWLENEDKSYVGESSYNFSASVSAPPTFHLAKDTAHESKFVVITAVGASDPSRISFSSDPAMDSSPVFYKADGDSYGILPIPAGSAGSYTVTLSYGGASSQLNLKVSPFAECTAGWYSVEKAKGIPYSAETFASAYSESARNEFAELVKTISNSDETKAAAQTKYFDGYFLGPRQEYGKYAASKILYGEKIAITGNENDSMTFVSEGLDQIYSGNVPAANAGKVVYTGSSAYSGNLVVIEHGWGLKTWYWNLGDISVKAGDAVNRGDVIGKTGSTGFSMGGEGVHVAMSVGDKFVCPYDTWSDADGFKEGVQVYYK